MITMVDLSQEERPLLDSICTRFANTVGSGVPLFTTDASGLWEKFLSTLPDHMRQQYTCRACQRFVETYGGLVTIVFGRAVSAMWWPCIGAGPFNDALGYLQKTVESSRVTGVFLSADSVWGTSQNYDAVRDRDWHHMHVVPPAACVRPYSPVNPPSQAMALKMEEYRMLCRGLEEFPVEVVRNAYTLLTGDQLPREEKCRDLAKWLLDLQEARGAVQNSRVRENLTWVAVAGAPAGWCHIRTGMIGTLLEDIQAGLDFPRIQRRWTEKMNPLQYLRPQVAPSAGNIAQAEKIMEALQSAGSLARRFAKLEDCVLVWRPVTPSPEKSPGSGVFAHLKPKGAPVQPLPVAAPSVTMTWEKFARVVLSGAEKIELLVPSYGNFTALVTAVNAEAPPIIQWDRSDRRNPVTSYVYSDGSGAVNWNLSGDTWCSVTGITLAPAHWYGDGLESQTNGVNFLLEGARDTRHQRSGGFFPETLRSEYHPIRATLEAYAKEATIAGRDEATACGYALTKGQSWSVQLRVTSRMGRATYKLDRWD